MSEPWRNWIPGVLNKGQMKALFGQELIVTSRRDGVDALLDESSLDLTLSNEAYRMLHGSVKPVADLPYTSVLGNAELAQRHEPQADGSYCLRAKQTYVFKLSERLHKRLAEGGIYGQATAKSSVGRVDVLARLIVDGMETYESFTPEGVARQSGDLYLEVTPITFSVLVRPGTSLSQLRLFYGEPDQAEIRSVWLYRSVFPGQDKREGALAVSLEPTVIGGLETVAFCAEPEGPERAPVPLWEEQSARKPDPPGTIGI